MKLLRLTLLILLSVICGAAQTIYAPGTLSASCNAVTGTGRCTALYLAGNSLAIGVTWQISFDTGTANSISVTLQGSNDNSTWTTLDTNTACLTTGGSGCSRSLTVTSYRYLACNVGTYSNGTTNKLTCSLNVNPNGGSPIGIHGTITPGNCTSWFNSATIQDAGATCGGSASGVSSVSGDGALITNSGSTGAVTLTVGSAPAHQFWNGAWTRPTCGDLSNAAASCSTDATNAGNISSGTLGAARLPNPSSSTLGGVQSISAITHNFLTSISTSGVPAQAQPTCSDLSNASASCSTDATNASNIGSGTLALGRLSLTNAHLYVGNGSGNPADVALSGDCGITNVGVETCTQLNGSNFTVNTSGVPTKVAGNSTVNNGVPAQVFATPAAITMTGSTGDIGGTITMVTPGASGYYQFAAIVSQTAACVGSPSGTSTVGVKLAFTDGDASQTIGGSANVTFLSLGVASTATAGNMTIGSGALSASAVFTAYPRIFYAKSGTAITYTVTVTANTLSCATSFPTLEVRPILIAM